MKGTVQLQRFNMRSNLTKCDIPSSLSQGILNFADNVAQGEQVSWLLKTLQVLYTEDSTVHLEVKYLTAIVFLSSYKIYIQLYQLYKIQSPFLSVYNIIVCKKVK